MEIRGFFLEVPDVLTYVSAMGRHRLPRTPEHRARIAAALRGKPKSDAHRAALSKPKSEATKAKLSTSASSAETSERRRMTMLVRHGVEHPKHIREKNNLAIEYWLAKGLSSGEASRRISAFQAQACAKRGHVVSHWSHKYWTKRGLSEAEASAKVSALQAANAARSAFTVSRESTAFFDRLQELGGREIVRERTLLGRFKVDGMIPSLNLVIEYFGSFWHMHPSLFQPNDEHRVTGWKASAKWAEDRGRVDLLERAGYLVWVVWDFEAPTLLHAFGRSLRCAATVECNDFGEASADA